MPEPDDIALLKEYAERGSEEAFTALVGRHVNLVYSAALRRVGSAHAAEEIAQAVFVILARKAKSLGGKTVLSGWLYQTTRLTAANYVRGEIRRQHREQEATMQSILSETEAEPEVWRQIAPLLDDAMGRLGEKDRNAIVLRFFENKNLAEVGAALGASEDAAKMRVNRALEKLRAHFTKRGVASTAAAIAETISANSILVAPAALAKTATAVALAKGATASTSTLTLIKGALKIMAWTKAKTAIVVGAAILLAGGTTFVAVKKTRGAGSGYSWEVFDPAYAGVAHTKTLRKARTVPGHPNVPMPNLEPVRLILSNTPPQVTIVPTKFPKGGMLNGVRMWAWMTPLRNGEAIGMNCPAEEIIRYAMGDYPRARTMVGGKVLKAYGVGVPERGYDFIANLPNGSRAALKAEMEQKFGLTGSIESRQTDVLILRVKSATARGDLQGTRVAGEGGSRLDAISTSQLASGIETLVNVPVVDDTGLTNHFELTLKWNEGDKLTSAEQLNRSLDKIGLELVSARRNIEMLVVGKTK
jgi:RNA polymerase sigma factor (sigma-70 family)